MEIGVWFVCNFVLSRNSDYPYSDLPGPTCIGLMCFEHQSLAFPHERKLTQELTKTGHLCEPVEAWEMLRLAHAVESKEIIPGLRNFLFPLQSLISVPRIDFFSWIRELVFFQQDFLSDGSRDQRSQSRMFFNAVFTVSMKTLVSVQGWCCWWPLVRNDPGNLFQSLEVLWKMKRGWVKTPRAKGEGP